MTKLQLQWGAFGLGADRPYTVLGAAPHWIYGCSIGA